MIILASASERRIELLRLANITFKVKPANINEEVLAGERPEELVCRLATEKAQKVCSHHPNNIVIGADTIVYFQEQIIGKPTDLGDAKRILQKLKGNTHFVYTGVCLAHKETNCTMTWSTITSVTFRNYTDEELDYCLSTGQPLDKAGGYAFQDHENILISQCNGLRSNVIGLPIEEVLARLKTFQRQCGFRFEIKKGHGSCNRGN